MYKVFVYGSLLSGMGNHALLKDATFIGKAKTKAHFKMLDLGWFPGVIEDRNGIEIHGEVYEVTEEQLHRLDRLEGYNESMPHTGLYNRIEIDTTIGKSIIYIYNNHYGRASRFVADGDWATYINNIRKNMK